MWEGIMDKATQISKLASSQEERILLARAADQIKMAQQRSVPTHTPFLSPHERVLVEKLIAASGYPRAQFLGGYEEAERRICVFLPDWMEEATPEDVGLCAIQATWKDGRALTHRDFLGSLMGMGITREKLGDFLVGEGRCDIILLEELQNFLLQNLESAGRSKLQVKELPLDQLEIPVAEVKTIRDTVATLRLDAVAAAGFSTSRSKMVDYISAGKVNVNWQECTKPDFQLAQGDTISCRGLGKCQLTEVKGLSKKGRTMIVMERYQ
jgi:RNA-binding protein YlmH